MSALARMMLRPSSATAKQARVSPIQKDRLMKFRTPLSLITAGLIGAMVTLGADRLLTPSAGAQELPAVVQAQRFELIDDHGTVRGVFGMATTGPWLTLVDPSGQVRLVLQQTVEGTYAIGINDADGTPRFGVGTTAREGGFVGLNVRDAKGAIRSRVFASDDGTQTGFQVQDPPAKLRAEMALNSREDRAGLQVRDPNGTVLWQAP
jgi:hypothetical protein